ncbi:hypothetical protein KRR40_37865 [Niabella defluvii]|nr:hypothetical protein KRR40_37865 [Niabella sp. I65]
MDYRWKAGSVKRDKQGSFIYYRAQTTDSIGATPLNRFNAYCNNRYRGQFDVIELPYGAHQVEVRVSGQKADKEQILPIDKRDDINHHPQKYDQSVIYLGRILIRGTLLQ